MFIQVIQGKVKDSNLLNRQLEKWRSELKPGARGYLGSTGGVTPDGRGITMVRFESEDAAQANSDRAEQAVWWSEMAKAYEGTVTFHSCREVDMSMGGGSNKAGFVQVIQGRAKDQAEMRRLTREHEQQLHENRPDILGIVVGWHGDGGFTQAVYFTSAEAAHKGEASMANDDLGRDYMSFFDGEPTFFDLATPDLD